MRKGFVAAAVAAVALVPVQSQAQSVQEIVEAAMEAYTERMEGIDNYTVYSTTLGTEVGTYFERPEEGGMMFRPVRMVGAAGDMPLDQAEGASAYTDPWSNAQAWIEHAVLEGREDVDGEESFVIRFDEFPEEAFPVPEGGDGSPEFEPQRARMYVDADDYLIRRMVIEGVSQMQGERREGTMEVSMTDYRTVDGLVHPFEMRIRASGILDDEELEQARQALEQMNEQLEAMPEAQRSMLEGMMKGQLDQIRQMVSAGEGLEITVLTSRVEVNQGPPGG